jgi:hypothetical protein
MARQITIRDRFNYEMSFTLAERWERFKDKAAHKLARSLPKRVRMWAVITAHVAATKPNQHPDTVSAFDLYR